MTTRSSWKTIAPSHRRWALIALVPTLWLAVTGALLGLKPWIAFRGDSLGVSADREALPLGAVLASVDRNLGRARVESFHPPVRPGAAYRAILRADATGAREVALFHPANGAWLGVRSAREENFWKLLYRLHRGKVLELPGQVLVTLGALALFIVAWSGLRLLRFRWRTGTTTTGRRRWHSWAGASACLLLLPVFLTGIPLNFQSQLASWIDPVSRGSAEEPLHPLPWPQLIASAAATEMAWEGIYFPRKTGDPYQFFARDGARRYVDAHSGQLLLARDRTRTGAMGLIAWLYPIHGGQALGAVGRWLVLLGAVLLLVVVWTGLRLPVWPLSWQKKGREVARSLGRVSVSTEPAKH